MARWIDLKHPDLIPAMRFALARTAQAEKTTDWQQADEFGNEGLVWDGTLFSDQDGKPISQLGEHGAAFYLDLPAPK